MELRDFAEQVLFSSSLEEKLFVPAVITDEHPGSPIVSPLSPGRPSFLRFKSAQSESPGPPKADSLETSLQRGRLLHFFANHELLATELMALVLLRFPEAPPAFRKGVYNTLLDEQQHTRLYLSRMQECGVSFGELPVSGFFWKCVSSMESPMDYVSSLSLTFEQANLDFCKHFAGAFSRVGDVQTADLLEGIYKDEIHHVAYGLKWFRRWKQAGDTDWDAFCRVLKFPLSPRRAKGFGFNSEGRRAAGFESDFIQHLEVFARSKGRTPWVALFNPFSEGYMAYGPGFTPNKHQAALVRDLQHLPMFLGGEDDIVLVKDAPSPGYLSRLKAAGLGLAEFRCLAASTSETSDGWEHQKLRGFRPWAWGPDSAHVFASMKARVGSVESTVGTPIPSTEALAALYSKRWSAEFLGSWLSEKAPLVMGTGSDWLCPGQLVGRSAHGLSEALELIAWFRSLGHERLVVKRAYGLAGGNAIRLWEPILHAQQRSWLEDAVTGRDGVVIEPWLDRVLDYSIQLESTGSGLELVGYTTLLVDHRGQYIGNEASPGYARHAPAKISELLRRPGFNPGVLAAFHARLIKDLSPHFVACGHVGPVGIDAFVYRDAVGVHRLKPVVEINPRHTMGRVLLSLMRFVAPGSHGASSLVNAPMVKAVGMESFRAYAEHVMASDPVRLRGEPKPRIWEGTVVLNDAEKAEVVLACLSVRRAGNGTKPTQVNG